MQAVAQLFSYLNQLHIVGGGLVDATECCPVIGHIVGECQQPSVLRHRAMRVILDLLVKISLVVEIDHMMVLMSLSEHELQVLFGSCMTWQPRLGVIAPTASCLTASCKTSCVL